MHAGTAEHELRKNRKGKRRDLLVRSIAGLTLTMEDCLQYQMPITLVL